MPSNEAIELLESVLSSVNESERWQYRHADLLKKKQADLEDQLEDEEKKIIYYGKKDQSKYKKIGNDLANLYNLDHNSSKINNYRKGIGSYINNGGKLDLNPKSNSRYEYDEDEAKNRHNYLQNMNKEKITNSPKSKDMHDRINLRTAAFDTTAKHEAAMILIEALNTLLNE